MRRRRCTIPPPVLPSGALICSLPVPASRTHPCSQGNRRHRMRHLADPDHGQLLIEGWLPLNLPYDVQNIRCLFATLTLTSANTALMSSTLAAFWLRRQLQQFSYVGTSQASGSGHTGRRARQLLIQAALWAPGMNERDIILEARAELPDFDDSPPARWPGPSDPDYHLSPTQPMVRRSEMAPAIRVKSLPPPLKVTQHCSVRVPTQTALHMSPARHHLIVTPHHDTNNHKFTHLLSPLLSQNLVTSLVRAAWQHHARAPPKHFHQCAHRQAYKYATKFRAEMQREESREWTVLPNKEPSSGNSMTANYAEDEKERSVLPRGSVIQQNVT